VKCPICNQEVQPSDHSEQWGPEFAHSRCVVAFNAGSAVQDAKLLDRIKRLEKDSERLHWLLKRGLAWRGCYDGHWLEGEWLYSSQYAIATIDKAKEAKL
jgi:hypothetical protein